MMKKLWDFCKNKNLEKENQIKLFLLLNILCWGGIGAIAWLAVSRIALNSMTWLFVFVGYAGVFPGWIGGVLKAMNTEQELSENNL